MVAAGIIHGGGSWVFGRMVDADMRQGGGRDQAGRSRTGSASRGTWIGTCW